MSLRNLDSLFRPESIALVGASNRPGSLGAVMMRNLLRGGFAKPILPVHPREEAVAGVLAYPDVSALPIAPDLAVICTPPRTVPDLVGDLGARGTRAVIVVTAGLSREPAEAGGTLQDELLARARPTLTRVLGPNCLGLIVPGIGLNATFAHRDATPGRIAFVSQSGALCASVLDWAVSNDVGFSHFVSLGDAADVDFGDTLDYLGSDPETDSILLYIESIGADEARKFMSAARAAARNKPVVVVKSGRYAEGAAAAKSHTGALAGSDAVYDAAIRRAGMLRVSTMDELFDAVETLARARPPRGDRLAIVTNGGGPGVLATDALIARGGRLAVLADETMAKLDAALPPTWSRGNPVDIIGDAPGERYAGAVRAVLDDPGVDAVLVMNVPTAIASSDDAARHVISEVRDSTRPVFTNWMGRGGVAPAQRLLRDAGIPTYDTPDDAVRAFMQIIEYRRNQDSLMQVPQAEAEFAPAIETVRGIIERALTAGPELLTEPDAKAVLGAYGIPIVETRVAVDVEEAVAVAERLGYPVALKILSPEISHKSDVGGVALDLESPESLRAAAQAMLDRVRARQPDARVEGFTVQEMVRRPRAHELIVGATTDAIFGPVIMFGHGGTAVEVLADRAFALPPLNRALARETISRTRVERLLRGYRDRPAADLDTIEQTLVRVSRLLIDHPEIAELDINPLLADEDGVLALDARVRVATPESGRGAERLAIRPYPAELEERIDFHGQALILRPIRPEDDPAHQRFVERLSPEDMRWRFFGTIRRIAPSQMARLTQIDYDREMAFIATTAGEPDDRETLGVVRVAVDPDNVVAEFAIVVRTDLKRRGLGRTLMDKMLRYCRDLGTREMVGDILRENDAMLELSRSLGFTELPWTEPEIARVRLELASEPAALAAAGEAR